MIGREKRVLPRHYLEQGMTKAAIARKVRVSRDTIHRWIATGRLDRRRDDALKGRINEVAARRVGGWRGAVCVQLRVLEHTYCFCSHKEPQCFYVEQHEAGS